jgi:hypothetical protein
MRIGEPDIWTMMDRTEYFSDEELSRFNLRGHANLNKMAQVCIENRATNPDTALSLSSVARRAGIDISQASRLLSNKPGFVRTMRQQGNKKPVMTGVYYMPAFYSMAQVSGHYYPHSVMMILKWVAARDERLVKAVIDVSGERKQAISGPKPDKGLVADMTLPYESTLTVPTLLQDPRISVDSATGTLARLTNDVAAFDDYTFAALPLKDRITVRNALSAIVRTSAGLYQMVQSTIDAEEIK